MAYGVNLGTNNGLELVIPENQCVVPDISEDQCLCGITGDWLNNLNRCATPSNATGYNWDKFSSESCFIILETPTVDNVIRFEERFKPSLFVIHLIDSMTF